MSMVDDIRARVGALQVRDPEVAHSEEDQIHVDALTWIVEHSTDDQAAAVASEALRTLAIRFPRWTA